MKFTVKYTLKNLYEAQRRMRQLTKARQIVFILFVVSLFLMPLIRYIEYGLFKTDDLVTVSLGVIFLFYHQIILRISAYYIYRKNLKYYFMSTCFEFDENGVDITSESINSKVKWDGFSKFIVNDKMLLLYTTSQIAVMVPKRIVKSEEDWWDLMELIKNKLPKT